MNSLENQEQEMKMYLTDTTVKHLQTSARWTKFYSILCFICVGILVIVGISLLLAGELISLNNLLINPAMNGMNMGTNHPFTFIGILYIILGLIMIIPAVYLYQYSKRIEDTFLVNNVATLEVAIGKMKSYWQFMGIFSIVTIIATLVFIVIILINSCMV